MDRLLQRAVLLLGAVCGCAWAAEAPSLLWADFKEPLQSHSGAPVLPLALSDKPGDVSAEPLRVREGQVLVSGRLSNANGGQWATLGMEVSRHAGGTPVDLSGYQHMRIRLSSAVPRVLRIRLKGSDPKFLNTGCYPVMLQQVGPKSSDYVIPLSAFEPQPWCIGRGAPVEQTLPAVVSVEVTANEPEAEPVRYTVGRVEFLRSGPAVAAPLPSGPRQARDAAWKLAWADEFNAAADQAADASRWSVVRTPQPAQADSSREASHDGQGHMAIRLREADAPASTRLQVKPAGAMLHGRVEVRFKAPERAGLSASLSLLGAPLADLPWPEAGEIVLLETQGDAPAALGLHGPGLEDDTHLSQIALLPTDAAGGDGFHELAVEWEPVRMRWLLDGVLVKTQLRADLLPASREVFGQWPFLLNIGLASSAGTPGTPPRGKGGGSDARLLIDHVRVYQRDDLAAAARTRLAAWQAQRSAMAAPTQGKEQQARKRKPAAESVAPQQPVRQVVCERNNKYGLMMCH